MRGLVEDAGGSYWLFDIDLGLMIHEFRRFVSSPGRHSNHGTQPASLGRALFVSSGLQVQGS